MVFNLYDEIRELGYKDIDIIEEDGIYHVRIDDKYNFADYEYEVFREIKAWHESKSI